jgi:hypothetical protein
MMQNQLVGTWKLVSYEIRGSDGQVHYLMGKDPVGYIMYGKDGYMHVAFMQANRAKLGVDFLPFASTEEKAAAAVTFESYCGKYEIKGDRVMHHVEVSLNPNYTGEVLERAVQLNANSLVLTMPPILISGISYIGRLVWMRV